MQKTRLFAMLAGAAMAAARRARHLAQTDVKFALDWKFEGPSAPYFRRHRQGLLTRPKGLNVTVE